MSGRLTVVSPGAQASLQDAGRSGLRRVGVPRAGALEAGWLRLANALAGNPGEAAAIEFFGGGLVLRADAAPLRLGLAGPFATELIAADGTKRILAGWRSLTLAPGEQLRCGMTQGARVGYVAVAGLVAPKLLGSASTYARAGFGRLLTAGATLPAEAASGGLERCLAAPPALTAAPIRVVLGPQADYFDGAAQAAFLAGPYVVTAESDRMGMRLAGPPLAHRPEKGAEIVSDATVPGSIQVPGNGRPIVLLNDGQTAGGYPKIATVISADLPRLAVLPVGAALAFAAVPVATGEAAAREREAGLCRLLAAIVPLAETGAVDGDAIYGANLISGMVNALA